MVAGAGLLGLKIKPTFQRAAGQGVQETRFAPVRNCGRIKIKNGPSRGQISRGYELVGNVRKGVSGCRPASQNGVE